MAGSRGLIDCCTFVDAVRGHGWVDAAGVPCGTFAGPIAHLSAVDAYEASAHEGAALASAIGAALAGRRRAVLLQNSGLGNLVNPLASLAIPYAVPVLAFMSLRGWPDESSDEPQHAVMGRASPALLESLGVWSAVLDRGCDQLIEILDAAELELEAGRSAFVLVPRGKIGRHPETTGTLGTQGLPTSEQVAAAITGWVAANDLVISTTGYLSRYLYAAADRPRNFYMQGSMGHAAAIALGYSTARPESGVTVLDGDGALLMQLGVLSTIGAAAPRRLTHIVVDNGGYASTGGQLATSRQTDLSAVALACGYRSARTVADIPALRAELAAAERHHGPRMIVVRTRSSAGAPPDRASAALPLPEVAARVRGSGPT